MNRRIKLGVIASAALVPLMAISCSENNTYQSKSHGDIWSSMNSAMYFDAIVSHWEDGDTLTVKKLSDGSDVTIRVQHIDTLEINHSNALAAKVSAEEDKWGQKATDFAKNIVPIGTKVRLVNTGTLTYRRLVAAIFFGDGFKDSFEERMLAAGMAVPKLSISDVDFDTNVAFYTGLSLANAFNYAYSRKIGIWSIPTEEINSWAHGLPPLTHLFKDTPDNIYDEWKDMHGN